MSKCDVFITLENESRSFHGGETVHGTVVVHSKQSFECKRITIKEYWQTHGRGNTDRGPQKEIILYTGQLEAGKTYEFPFEIELPASPATYHGHYVNIDHYLHAQVHVSWAIDPKQTIDIVVESGGQGRSDAPTTSPGAEKKLKGASIQKGTLIVGVIVMGISIFFGPCALIVFPIGLIIMLAGFRNWIAERRIGKVELNLDRHQFSSGDHVEAELVFTPRKVTKVNGIKAKLIGKEEAVSGSGSNRTTHTHELYEESFELLGGGETAPDQPVRLPILVSLPQTQAYSFHASDNKIIWQLKITIDIPRWPDWSHDVVLALVPKSGSASPAAGRSSSLDTSASSPAAIINTMTDTAINDQTASTVDDHEKTIDPPTPIVREVPPIPAYSDAGNDAADLLPVIASLKSADSLGDERKKLVDAHASRHFDIVIEIDRVDWTFPSQTLSQHEGGRTLVGTLVCDHEEQPAIALRFPEKLNEQLDALHNDTKIRATASIGEWNNFYERVEMIAESDPAILR